MISADQTVDEVFYLNLRAVLLDLFPPPTDMSPAPTMMNALWYKGPGDFKVKQIATPQYGDYDVLIKVRACGICGSDNYIDKGVLFGIFPVCTGHEIVGEVAAFGKDVQDLAIGDRCVLDPINPCTRCFHCRRDACTFCEKNEVLGVTKSGGFAEYTVVDSKRVHRIYNVTDEEATLIEPTSCVIRAIDKLNNIAGVTALVIGSGPSGLMLAQLLRLNGAQRVTLASNKGIKMQTARRLECADEYVELNRENADEQWEILKKDNPYGFDVVVEATGSTKVANLAINYVRKGGKLLLYSAYAGDDCVQWSPMKIFLDEITIVGSFAQELTFPRAVAYIDSGKLKVQGMVSHIYKLADYREALAMLNTRNVVKIVVKP